MKRVLRAFLPWLILGFVLWGGVIVLALSMEPESGETEFVYPI